LSANIAEVIQQRRFVSRLGLEVKHSSGQISKARRKHEVLALARNAGLV
jgi:hypothetical protein